MFAECLRRGGFGSGALRGDFAYSQHAVGGHAFVRHDAKQLARRQAGKIHEHLEIEAAWKALPGFPRTDGGNGNAQSFGNGLERNLVFTPPVAKGVRKAGANLTLRLTRAFLFWDGRPGRVVDSLCAHENPARYYALHRKLPSIVLR